MSWRLVVSWDAEEDRWDTDVLDPEHEPALPRAPVLEVAVLGERRPAAEQPPERAPGEC